MFHESIAKDFWGRFLQETFEERVLREVFEGEFCGRFLQESFAGLVTASCYILFIIMAQKLNIQRFLR